jgi:carboxypeptidase Taq
MFQNKVVLELLSKYKSVWALLHLQALGSWDSETYMPSSGLNTRGEALAKVSSLVQDLLVNKDFRKLLDEAKEQSNLNDAEVGLLRLLERDFEMNEKLPKAFVEKYAKTVSESQAVWREARQQNDFKKFQPYLERIVNLTIEQADYLGYKDHPYDALANIYEEGWNTKDIEKYFSSIKAPLTSLVKKIKTNSQNTTDDYSSLKYDIEVMKRVNKYALELFKYDNSVIRLDESAHPFTQEISIEDCRITTRYPEESWGSSLSATIHEFGHGLYSSQINKEFEFTPLSFATSLVLHESQSRFWENFIGRSKEFLKQIEHFIPDLSPEIKQIYSKTGIEGVYKYFNNVSPSLIRIEADEVTYHSHIMLRFEIEKALVEKSIKVQDLPEIWNHKMNEYLGVVPKTDSEGVLQDIHWSMGSIGYFPTYSMGTALSAQLRSYMENDLGGLQDLITNKKYVKIKKWLGEKIHLFGPTYTMKDLLKKQFNAELDPSFLLKYLENKYL